MRASDPDTKPEEVRGHVCCQLSLILTASLGLAQKLLQLESQLRARILILLTEGRFPGNLAGRARGQHESEARLSTRHQSLRVSASLLVFVTRCLTRDHLRKGGRYLFWLVV